MQWLPRPGWPVGWTFPPTPLEKLPTPALFQNRSSKNLVTDEIRWDAIINCYFKKAGNKNTKVYVDETLVLQIQGLDINFRQSIQDIATNTRVSIGTIQGLAKKRLLKKCQCNLKPLLTDDYKLLWVAWIRNLNEEVGHTVIWCSMSTSMRSGLLLSPMAMATTYCPPKNTSMATCSTRNT